MAQKRVFKPSLPPSPSTLPLGDLVETVTRSSLKAPSHVTSAKITGTKPVSSYSWIEDSSPKIMIPGKPPRWTPSSETIKLREDSGNYFRDINSASYPRHPMEPTVVTIMKTERDTTPVDIVACGSTISNLLRFIGVSRLDRETRILVETVGDTVHLIRREESPTELIEGVHGYGHAFAKAYTTLDGDTKQSYSHQSIISYQFGDLHMMVRFEVDGFMEAGKAKKPTVSRDSPDIESLCGMSALGIGDPDLGFKDDEAVLQVVQGGALVPQGSTFDLKTRWGAYAQQIQPTRVLQQQIHRLWVSQTKRFIVAYHKNGEFRPPNIKVMKIGGDIEQWENDMQSELKRLAGLIHLIVDRARKADDGKLELVLNPDEKMEIRKQASPNEMLSASVRKDWATWLAGLGSADAKEPIEDLGPGDDIVEKALDYTACDEECEYCGECEY